MTTTAWFAAAGTLLFIVAGAVFFFIGSRIGRRGELRRQQQAKATAEETAKRIVGEAERESESLRKAAVLSGPGSAERWLRYGGVVVFEDGSHVAIESREVG